MAELQSLAHLQEVDVQIEAETVARQEIQAALAGDTTVGSARARVAELGEKLHGLEGQLRELEWDAERISGEIAKDEERLYGGKVRNPKELDGIQKDLEQRKARRRVVEDKELELMTDQEAAESELKDARAALASAEAAWRVLEESLLARQEQTRRHLGTLQVERARVVGEITPPTIILYDRLRREKHGRAVSRVDRSTCLGCRIALPSGVVSHIRQGRDLVFCPSCGRILTL